MISNATLLLQYGLYFCDFIEEYVAMGGFILMPGCGVFLMWRPHIKRVVALVDSEERLAAISVLAAAIKRRCLHVRQDHYVFNNNDTNQQILIGGPYIRAYDMQLRPNYDVHRLQRVTTALSTSFFNRYRK
jgi:hypothetical protein